jgi:hypothetical protein
MAERVSLESRLHARTIVDPESGCYCWQGYRNSDGYGEIKVDGAKLKVHRVSYALFVDDLIDGLHIDHVRARGCRHRNCWNPDHLEQVTPQENTRRAFARIADVPATVRVVGRWFDVPQDMDEAS